jgi:ribosomal protein L12E/L44/L45/RPP1/RPP2
VGKLEAGVAIVLTEDMEMMELPQSLLPAGATVDSMFRMQLNGANDAQKARTNALLDAQQVILSAFGRAPNAQHIATALTISSLTHTTVTIRWPSARTLFNRATLYAIDGTINGRPLPCAAIDTQETLLRITGLEPATTYTLKLTFRTSAGTYSTDPLSFETKRLDDLTCLRVSVDEESIDDLLLEQLRALGVQVEEFSPDTTSLIISGRTMAELRRNSSNPVSAPFSASPAATTTTTAAAAATTTDGGEKNSFAPIDFVSIYQRAQEANIPIVTPAWIAACQKAGGRMQPVSQFYPPPQ